MILMSSLFKVVAYLAAWRAGLPTLTSSPRPRRYNKMVIKFPNDYTWSTMKWELY